MLVSIIIPVYNVEAYLEECVNSVLHQSYKNLEIILVDDGSTDKSSQLCDSFCKTDSRIRVIHKSNGGVSSARNIGVDDATGDFVFFLDSDDKIFPNCMETLVSLARRYEGVDIVQGNVQIQDGTKPPYICVNEDSEYITDVKKLREGLINSYPITSWNKLIKLSFLRENNIRFMEGIIHEDEMFRWSLHKFAETICFTKEITYWYRKDNDSSITNQKDCSNFLLSGIEMVKKIASEIKSKKEAGFALRFVSAYKKSIIEKCYSKEEILDSIRFLRKSESVPLVLKFDLLSWELPAFFFKSRLFRFLFIQLRRIWIILTLKKL